MDVTLILLLSAAPIGAFDVIYYHLWKFRLFERPESTREEVTHILRGFLVPALTGILLIGRPEGTWFWVVLILFALDSLNTLLDVVFEPRSRAPRGVPPSELAVHFVGTTAMGAALATFILAGWASRLHATDLTPHVGTVMPGWFFKFGYFGLVGAFALVIFEACLFARAISRRAMNSERPIRD